MEKVIRRFDDLLNHIKTVAKCYQGDLWAVITPRQNGCDAKMCQVSSPKENDYAYKLPPSSLSCRLLGMPRSILNFALVSSNFKLHDQLELGARDGTRDPLSTTQGLRARAHFPPLSIFSCLLGMFAWHVCLALGTCEI